MRRNASPTPVAVRPSREMNVELTSQAQRIEGQIKPIEPIIIGRCLADLEKEKERKIKEQISSECREEAEPKTVTDKQNNAELSLEDVELECFRHDQEAHN
ncbi:unnamed protein product [Sphagnum balticum]